MKPFPLPGPYPTAELIKAALERHFGNDDNYEIVLPDELDPTVEQTQTFPDGSTVMICTNYAIQVFRELECRLGGVMDCKLFGFSEENNPSSAIAQGYGGHDFALVDHRYIVDGWLKNVDETSEVAVFDLLDPIDKVEVARLYGNWDSFERLETIEQGVRREFEPPKSSHRRP